MLSRVPDQYLIKCLKTMNDAAFAVRYQAYPQNLPRLLCIEHGAKPGLNAWSMFYPRDYNSFRLLVVLISK